MRKYLDMQCEEKIRIKQYDKILNDEQGRIWRKDAQKYKQDILETQNLVYFFNEIIIDNR